MRQVQSRSLTIKLVTKKELAETFAVSLSTIQREMRDGLAEAAGIVIRGQWRFDLTKAWEWFRQKGT